MIIVFITVQGFSQNASNIDEESFKVLDSLLYYDLNAAYRFSKKLESSSDICTQYHGFKYEAIVLYNQSDFNASKSLLLRLISKIERNKNFLSTDCYIDLKTTIISRLFYIEKNLGNYKRAIYYIEKFKSGLPSNQFDLHYAIAKIDLGNYEEGIAIIKKCTENEFFKESKDKPKDKYFVKLLADRYNAIGEGYQKFYLQSKKKSHIDSAAFYFSKATKILLSNNFMPEYSQALLVMRQAKNAILLHEYDKALQLYRKKKLFPVLKEMIRTEQVFDIGMADCFNRLKETDSAIIYSQRFIKLYKLTKVSKENLLTAYSILANNYNKKSDSKNAYFYAQQCLQLSEEINNDNSKALDFIHDYDIKKISENANQILKEKNKLKLILFVVLILLGAFGYFINLTFRMHKQKQKKFLVIIDRLMNESSDSVIKERLETNVFISKTKIDEGFVDKVSAGLLSLEVKKAYLKPNFKLSFVAKKLNTNTAYLSQYFNQHKRMTFSEYVQKLRINYVLNKLKDDTQFRKFTLQAIADEIGYKDATTFTRVFKKQTGISPNYFIDELNKSK